MLRHLISAIDLSQDEIENLIEKGKEFKIKKRKHPPYLAGKSIGLLFFKPSTRTRVSFEVGVYELGGYPVVLNSDELQLRRGESIEHTAKTLSRYLSAVVIRTTKHEDILQFAKYSLIPVINGLTNLEHPCQVLGDLLTIYTTRAIKSIKELRQLKIVYIGDGNNVANSWILLSSLLGLNFVCATPDGFEPNPEILKKSTQLAKQSLAKITLLHDPQVAAQNADVLYTDVWTSMGKEDEKEKRLEIFKSFQVNKELLALANKDCIIMHCLPARVGEEITEDVIELQNSVIFEQAENRLHIQKAILTKLV